MRAIAILNSDGGTLRTTDVRALCREMEAAFAEAGHSLDCRVVAGSDLQSRLDEAFADDRSQCVIAAGGDGTVSAAAEKAFETGKPFGLLPAGTMNMFARSLAMPLDLKEAVTALSRGRIGKADIATANGKPFIHQFSVGMQPRMVTERERNGYSSRLGKIMASARALISPIMKPPSFPAEIRAGATRNSGRMSLIAVSNNPHGEGHLPYPDTVDQGVLGIYFASELTPREGLRLATDITLGNWTANPDLVCTTAGEVELRFPRRKRHAKAVMDGELVPLEREVRLCIHKQSINVLIPISGEQ